MDGSGSLVRDFFRKKWVRLILILDVVVVFVVVGLAINNAMKTSVLSFNVVPIDAAITVNGDSGYVNGTYKVMPGAYEIMISHEGMTTKTFSVELGGEDIVNIVTYLVGEDGGFEFYELRDNYGSYVELSEIASAENNVTTDQDTSAEGFVAKMKKDFEMYVSEAFPIKYSRYEDTDEGRLLKEAVSIWRGEDDECEKILCLKVSMLFTDDKDVARELLAEKGFEVEDYEIIYENY